MSAANMKVSFRLDWRICKPTPTGSAGPARVPSRPRNPDLGTSPIDRRKPALLLRSHGQHFEIGVDGTLRLNPAGDTCHPKGWCLFLSREREVDTSHKYFHRGVELDVLANDPNRSSHPKTLAAGPVEEFTQPTDNYCKPVDPLPYYGMTDIPITEWLQVMGGARRALQSSGHHL